MHSPVFFRSLPQMRDILVAETVKGAVLTVSEWSLTCFTVHLPSSLPCAPIRWSCCPHFATLPAAI